MECYENGREVAMVMLQWVGEQLLPTINPPWKKMTTTTYGDIVALALCNRELHKVDRQGFFHKVYKQGCLEQDDLWT
jgi:hypothetical protein